MADRIFIVGLGSAGQRHARNAIKLGCEVVAYDLRYPDGVFSVEVDPGIPIAVKMAKSIEQALTLDYLGVIVATPPDSHAELLGRCVGRQLPTFVEKPLALDARSAKTVVDLYARRRIPFVVGYQLRQLPGLRTLKSEVEEGKYGIIFSAHAELSTDRWCSKTYEADLLLECSHELDLLRWFLGDPQNSRGIQVTPDLVVAQFYFPSRGYCGPDCYGDVRLDGLATGYRRHLVLDGTKGQAEWIFDQAENDQAYVDELADFLAVCRKRKDAPACSGEDGWWALRMVEAIRESARSGRWEDV